MKLGVLKLQEGGYMLYEPTPPIQSPVQEAIPTATQEKAENGTIQGIDKDLLKTLIGHGLTNDVITFKRQVDDAYSRYASMSVAEKESVIGRRLRQIMSGDFAQINAMINNKDQFEKAAENVKANLAESEYAVTNNGMVVMDNQTGKIGNVSFEEFSQNRDKFRALTNAELMRLRANDQSLSFDTQSFAILNNAVGMATLRKRVLDVIGQLGHYDGPGITSKDGNTQFGHSVVKAVASLKKSIDDGTYEANLKSNDQNIAIATSAILSSLNNNERAVLFARAAVAGATSQQDFVNYAAKEIGNLLSMNLTTVVDYTKGSGSGKSGKGSEDELGYYEQLANAHGAPVTGGATLNFGNSYKLQVAAKQLPGMIGTDGKPLGPSMLSNNKQLLSLINPKAFVFGDKQLDEASIDGVMYDGGSVEIFKAPAVEKNGQKVPDIHRIENYYEAEKEIAAAADSMGVKTLPVEAEARIMRKHGFSERRLDDVPTSLFGTTMATTYRNNVEGVDENLVTELTGDAADKYKSIFDKQYNYNGASSSKGNKSGRHDYTNLWGIGSGDNLIRSRIIFAIPKNAAGQARIVDGSKITTKMDVSDANAYTGGLQAVHNQWNTNIAAKYSASKL